MAPFADAGLATANDTTWTTKFFVHIIINEPAAEPEPVSPKDPTTAQASDSSCAKEGEEEGGLCRWKLGALARRAREEGVSAVSIEEALDTDDSKLELIAMLLVRRPLLVLLLLLLLPS